MLYVISDSATVDPGSCTQNPVFCVLLHNHDKTDWRLQGKVADKSDRLRIYSCWDAFGCRLWVQDLNVADQCSIVRVVNDGEFRMTRLWQTD